MKTNHLPVICLMGPTAVGKSQLAIDLAEALPCDIISVDSVMVYRGMDIGTAKPDAATLKQIPHHLVDIRDPSDPYSAGDFFKDVQKLIENSFQNRRMPLLVGGTMLYFNVLKKGLVDLPLYNTHPDYSEIKAELENKTNNTLYKELSHCDPITAKKLHIHDKQRVQHALLVYRLSKTALSELCSTRQKLLPYQMLWLAVYPETRTLLKEKIAIRFKQMLTQGLIEEVQTLSKSVGFSKELPAYRAIGYKQVIEYLENNSSLDELQSKGTIATCQLLKRQLTWLRKWPDLKVLQANQPNLLNDTKQYIKSQICY